MSLYGALKPQTVQSLAAATAPGAGVAAFFDRVLSAHTVLIDWSGTLPTPATSINVDFQVTMDGATFYTVASWTITSTPFIARVNAGCIGARLNLVSINGGTATVNGYFAPKE